MKQNERVRDNASSSRDLNLLSSRDAGSGKSGLTNEKAESASVFLLAINTALTKSEIAIFQGEKILAHREWSERGVEGERLLPAIEDCLNEAQIKMRDLREIFAVRGPGSFSGLRVGISVANTLAYLLKTRLYTMDSFDFLWRKFNLEYCPSADFLSRTALVLNAGSGEAFVSLNLGDVDEVVQCPFGDLADFLKKQKIEQVFGVFQENQYHFFDEFQILESGKNFIHLLTTDWQKEKYLVPQEPFQTITPLYLRGPGINSNSKYALHRGYTDRQS